MTAQEVLSEYVDKYRQLFLHPDADSGKVTEVFCKLRDLLLVELYFMKSIRMLVREEEMSGFVIYIEKKLRRIVDSYRPDKSEFLPYFRHVMEYRALSYLEENRKRRLVACAYESYYMHHAEEVAERSPEEIYMEELEKRENDREQRKLTVRLRHVCACRPSRRKNLFIFLCTLLPHLSSDAIDDFCRILNCNKDQTFAIAEHLCSLQSESVMTRGSRMYSKNRRDYFWMRKMEMEYTFDRSDRQDETLSGNLRRIMNIISNLEADRRKMNVEYSVLGRVLNMEPGQIANAVYSSRKLLSIVLGDGPQEGYIGKEARAVSGRKAARLDRFEPFKAFGISNIKRNMPYAEAS